MTLLKLTKSQQEQWVRAFGVIAIALLAAAQLFAVLTSPPDRDMGNLQKIMYVHVPAALSAFMCFGLVFAASVLYLWRGKARDDLIAASAAEAGAMFTGLTLALGSIWGRPTWGVWWAWDARLTSTAVLFVIFAGYLVLRAFADDEQRRAKWSAAIGIFGALNVPVVYMSVKWWRTLHQMESTPQTLDPAYGRALGTSVTAMMIVAIYFVTKRFQVARDERDAELAADRIALEFEDEELIEEEKEALHV